MTEEQERLKLLASNCAVVGKTIYGAAVYLHNNHIQDRTVTALRKAIERLFTRTEWDNLYDPTHDLNDFGNETTTETNQYMPEDRMSALREDGKIMDIQEYCETYGLPYDEARSYKLVTHTGIPRYNIASRNLDADGSLSEELSVEELKELIAEGISCYRYVPPVNTNHSREIIVVKISDLHFGAYIDNLIKTKNFSISILADLLNEAAVIINAQNAAEVYVDIHGDLIESFTGLNHKNSWKGLQKSMVGAEVVKLCTTVLHKDFLSRIDNLIEVKIVAGNHDRVTSAKDEDVDGDAANLIAWGLELMGYKVEFNPLVITHVVDGICYVCLHGDKGISSRPTKAIIWDYGVKGVYNVVAEGHLHALIEKQSLKKNDKKEELVITRDDSVDNVRMTLRSFFTGNTFSEYLGYTSNAGFSIIKNNGKGVPNIFHYAL